MEVFTFPAFCNYGKGDSGTSWIEVELNDEETELLKKYALQPDVYYNHFWKCDELSDLYDKIFVIADEQITDELGFMDEMLDEGEKASNRYWIGVDFPDEFEELLPEDE